MRIVSCLLLLVGLAQSFTPTSPMTSKTRLVDSTPAAAVVVASFPPRTFHYRSNTALSVSSDSDDSKGKEVLAIGFLLVSAVVAYNVGTFVLGGVTHVASDIVSNTGQNIMEGSGKLGSAVLQGTGAVAGATVEGVKLAAPVVGKALVGGGKALFGASKVVGEAASPYVQEAGKQISEASAPLVQETSEKLDATILTPLKDAASPYVQEATKQITEATAPLQEVSKQVSEATAPLQEASEKVMSVAEPFKNLDAGTVGGAVLRGTGAVAGAAVEGVKFAVPVVGKALGAASQVVGDAASPYVQEAGKQISEASAPLVQETSEKLDATILTPLKDVVESSTKSLQQSSPF